MIYKNKNNETKDEDEDDDEEEEEQGKNCGGEPPLHVDCIYCICCMLASTASFWPSIKVLNGSSARRRPKVNV